MAPPIRFTFTGAVALRGCAGKNEQKQQIVEAGPLHGRAHADFLYTNDHCVDGS